MASLLVIDSFMHGSGYKQRLSEIEDLVRVKRHSACVRECGQVFEAALRELLQQLINDLEDAPRRDEILSTERKIAKGGESFRRFGLGQLVGLYAEAKVFDKLRSQRACAMSKVRRISWNDVVVLRNEATHDDSQGVIDESDALQMYFWLKVFLFDTGLISTREPPAVRPQPRTDQSEPICPECKSVLRQDWRFCPLCGTALRMECAACGATLMPRFKICPYCETPVRGNKTSAIAIHEYELLFRGAFLDMIITPQERDMLEQKRLELGISIDQASEIEAKIIPKNVIEYRHLVEGVLVDGIINDVERNLLNRKIEELKLGQTVAAAIEGEIRRSYASPN